MLVHNRQPTFSGARGFVALREGVVQHQVVDVLRQLADVQ